MYTPIGIGGCSDDIRGMYVIGTNNTITGRKDATTHTDQDQFDGESNDEYKARLNKVWDFKIQVSVYDQMKRRCNRRRMMYPMMKGI